MPVQVAFAGRYQLGSHINMDMQQVSGSLMFGALAFASGGLGGYFLAKTRSAVITVESGPVVVNDEHLQPPKVQLGPLEFKQRLMGWRDRFQLELEKTTATQVKKIDDVLSEKSTWWGLFKMKSSAEVLSEALTASLLEVWSATDRLVEQLANQEAVADFVTDFQKFDDSPLLTGLSEIRFLPLNRDQIQEVVRAAFLGEAGVQMLYAHQSNQMIKKACAQL
jgi:hypothetical protein